MKLIKKNETLNYYQLSQDDMDEALYDDSEFIAIEKETLNYKTAKDALMDGDFRPVERPYEAKAHKATGKESSAVRKIIEVLDSPCNECSLNPKKNEIIVHIGAGKSKMHITTLQMKRLVELGYAD